ncbi:MAG: hypothetical protein A2Y28_00880 [Chlamydiae bacterium GWC2_50_10]|nr:MAG: hypothetical protein A2Z85_01165 [Chlamydiae bacterium GWA2_50_15]OGN53777.1 MAG: hypothetical protein A2Y28_00880 [Chlamydiae bacterium GWC2_50_10]OGN55090.1 MAG: hypothetical protein A2098_02855 [Chlamydiae bacterium GWF2_49_8]OGN57762.1 MAG: hypothetical protein A3D18_04870 [Chlamydiae bacterium RIFCSPHIGHO2_02_FULL_49_29]OGN68237.1 MAG: hypothetical protein A3I15_05155 [Chlamydiae bacterium RIFCSPLOWO2_02_FULL_49_12]OGN72868.1 MAG: hypothetical protein A3G30_01640 [Chlamydiae bacte
MASAINPVLAAEPVEIHEIKETLETALPAVVSDQSNLTREVAANVLNSDEKKQVKSLLKRCVIEPIQNAASWIWSAVILKIVAFVKKHLFVWRSEKTVRIAEPSSDSEEIQEEKSSKLEAALDKARDRLSQGPGRYGLGTDTFKLSKEQVWTADLNNALHTDTLTADELKEKMTPIKDKLTKQILSISLEKHIEGANKKGFAKKVFNDPMNNLELIQLAVDKLMSQLFPEATEASGTGE